MNSEGKNVFVVIVTYNGEQWIQKCLQSVYDSEVKLTPIVVDNASIDTTLKIIEQYFTEAHIINSGENLGFGAANNLGISYAIKKGADFVFLLNQDAYLEKDAVSIMLKVAGEQPEFGLFSPVHFNGDGSAIEFHFLKVIGPKTVQSLNSDLITKNYRKSIYQARFINAAAWMIPVNVFKKIGGFDPIFFMYGEDDNFCQRLLYHGFKIGVVPQAMVYHDTQDNNHQAEADSKKYFAQFLNQVKVRFANINTQEIKKLWRFKLYLQRKAVQKLLRGDIKGYRRYIKKKSLIDKRQIWDSYKMNQIKAPHYLDI